MVKINWTNFALKDLNEIADFISKDSVRYAQMTVKYLFESPTILKTHPKARRIVPNSKKKIYESLFGEVTELFMEL